jgi:O-antigen ligase
VPPATASRAASARERSGEGVLPGSLTAGVLGLALVFGGGTMQGLRADAWVQLASLPLLGYAIVALLSRPVGPRARLPLAIAATSIVLVLLHLIPLPPALWTQLPGRGLVIDAFELSGVRLGWMPVSLDPGATWRSVLSLLVPLAVFLAVLSMDHGGRRVLTLILVGFAVASVVLGLVQLMQGPGSALRFHAITNPTSSVGFFANRNHYAALLYAAVPFAAAWTIALASDRRQRLGAVGCGLALAALALGLGMALSRAGAVLGLAALGLSGFLLGQPRRGAIGALAVAGAIGAILVVHYALPGLVARFEAAPVDDYRFDILAITLAAARDFVPIGSGFGTFQAVYLMYDRPEALLANYVNHAHNDWAELWLEGGWLFALAAAGFLAWLALAGREAWRAAPGRTGDLDRALGRAASISVCLLLLHSLVDYPLRTMALLSVFALCCALLVRPSGGAADGEEPATGSGHRSGGPAGSRTRRFPRRRPARGESGPPVRAGATGPGSRPRGP